MRWMREKGGRDWFWGLTRETIVLGREREIECVVWERRMRSLGVIWMRVRTWIVVDLYDRYEWGRCVFVCSSTMWERGIFGEFRRWVMEMIWLRNKSKWKWVTECFKTNTQNVFSNRFFFFFFFFTLFLASISPRSPFHTEPSISLSWCPSWWLWEWLCWWWLLLRETTHKHFVTQFRVFVHWTVLGGLPHVVWAMITVLPSLLKTVQPGHVLFLA